MNEWIYKVLCKCLGLSPATANARHRIRPMYDPEENIPQFKRNADVVFYSMDPDPAAEVIPAAANMSVNVNHTHNPEITRFSAYVLQIICYGPGAVEAAKQIREFLYVDEKNNPLSMLREYHLYPVPDPPEPMVLREPEGGLWRLRADLTIRFRCTDVYLFGDRRNAITVAPAVRIISQNGKGTVPIPYFGQNTE